MMASGRTALASSGRISGSGLASARISGRLAMLSTISGLSTPPAETPRKMSAPSTASASVRAESRARSAAFCSSSDSERPRVSTPLAVRDQDVLALRTPRPTRMLRQAIAAAPAPEQTSLTSSILLPTDLQPIEDGRGRDDRGAVLVVVEHRDLHALAQPRLDEKHSGALMSSRLMPPKVGSMRGDDLDQLVGIGFVDLDIEHVDAGELLEQAALAFHHRLAGERRRCCRARAPPCRS